MGVNEFVKVGDAVDDGVGVRLNEDEMVWDGDIDCDGVSVGVGLGVGEFDCVILCAKNHVEKN